MLWNMKWKILTEFCVSAALSLIFLMRNVEKQSFFAEFRFSRIGLLLAPKNDIIMIGTSFDCAESYKESEGSMNKIGWEMKAVD